MDVVCHLLLLPLDVVTPAAAALRWRINISLEESFT
jgi:hypothetical protein